MKLRQKNISHRSQVVAQLAEKPQLDGEDEDKSDEKSSNCSRQSKALDQLGGRQVIRLQSLNHWLDVLIHDDNISGGDATDVSRL